MKRLASNLLNLVNIADDVCDAIIEYDIDEIVFRLEALQVDTIDTITRSQR